MKGGWPYTEETPSGAAPTSPPEGVFRHKRRMELDELSGRITGRLGYTCRLQPTPSEGRQRWHYDTPTILLRHRRDGNAGTTILYHLRNRRRPHSSSGMTAGGQGLSGMGTAAASAGAAGPSQGLRAGRSSGRTEAGVPRGERTTRLRTRADDRDSEPDYLLRPTRHGPGGTLHDY